MAKFIQGDHSRKAAEYYRKKILGHGPGAHGMDWKNKDSQYLRFDVIGRYIEWNCNPSILDVGCGSAEFFAYARKRCSRIKYTGIDVCEEMLLATQKKFPGIQTYLSDVESFRPSVRFDYVVASGTYNVKQSTRKNNWMKYFHNNLYVMYQLCRRGIVFNIMTEFVDSRYPHLYYATVDEISAFAVNKLSRRFIVDHSYPLFEFTTAVYRNNE